MSNLIQLASPAATVIAACVAVYFTRQLGNGQLAMAKRQADIAAQQARLADIRLQHDLFDRRFEIYEAARELLLEVFQNGRVSNEALSNFLRGTEKAVFVFDQNVTNYLAELRRQAINLQEVYSILSADRALPIGPERAAAAQREGDLKLWFFGQFDVLVERFKPFLALDKGTANHAPPE